MSGDAAQAPVVRRISLPADARPPVRVYVNGEEWCEGTDFTVDGTTLRFMRTLRPQPALGLRRKAMLAMGIGVYGDLKGDALDIQYTGAAGVRMQSIKLTMDHVHEPA